MTQMKDIGFGVWDIPRGGQIGLNRRVFIFLDQGTEHDLKETLGTGVDADAGVEIRRRLIQSNRDDLGVCGHMGATCRQKNGTQETQKAQETECTLSCACYASCVRFPLPFPFRHSADYTVTGRGAGPTTARRSFSICRVMRGLRCAR